jgi:Fe-S oxidoreductase
VKKARKDRLSKLKAKITYPDPCFLGRYYGVYYPPGEILRGMPGIELIEMERTRENSFHRDGGSGNFVMILPGGSKESPSRIRVREAYETGAETLVTVCPSCMTMLDNAVKDEELEGKLTVKDIAELVKESSKIKYNCCRGLCAFSPPAGLR